MPRVGFEATIPAFERAKTVHALDRAATVIGIKTYGGVIHIHPRILDLDTFRSWVMSFTARPLYPRGKALGTHWIGGWGGPQSRSPRRGEEKNLAPTGTTREWIRQNGIENCPSAYFSMWYGKIILPKQLTIGLMYTMPWSPLPVLILFSTSRDRQISTHNTEYNLIVLPLNLLLYEDLYRVFIEPWTIDFNGAVSAQALDSIMIS
jgi:hypothetical protein